MANEIIVDALPYIDQGYDEPGVRENAFAMVEEECRRYRPTKNYLEHLPPLNLSTFETTIMHNEFERLQNRLPMDTLSMKRYELPPPPHQKSNDENAWKLCVENSQSQLEHQSVRILNLQLMLEYCCPAWQHYLQTLNDLEKVAKKKLNELRQSLQEVNWQRKSLQTKGGEQLKNLEAKWVALVSHNYEIEQACCMAEEYLAQLKQNPLIIKEQHQRIEEQNQQQPEPEPEPEPEQSQSEERQNQEPEQMEEATSTTTTNSNDNDDN